MRLLKMYTQMGPYRYALTVKKMLEDDPFAAIDQVKAPCLVIRGGNDAIVSDEVARRLAAALPDAVYLPLDHAAHAIEYNNPAEFVEAMLVFLTRAEVTLGITEAADPSACQTGAFA
jgi:pimeloyl-ACP methyl ester carboxylesterase